MEADRQDQESESILDQVGRELAIHRQADVEVGHEHDCDGQQQEHELDIAPGARTEGGDGAHGPDVPHVPPVSLVVWHWIACTRRSVTSRWASSMLAVVTVESSLLR